MTYLTRSYEFDRPFLTLQDTVNRLFGDVRDGPWARADGAGSYLPRLDVSEDKEQILVTAELPGLSESEVELSFADGVLSIKGEKKDDRDTAKRTWYATERQFGAFLRSVQVHADVDETKLAATFKNGVLQVSLPKSKAPKHTTKRIAISGS